MHMSLSSLLLSLFWFSSFYSWIGQKLAELNTYVNWLVIDTSGYIDTPIEEVIFLRGYFCMYASLLFEHTQHFLLGCTNNLGSCIAIVSKFQGVKDLQVWKRDYFYCITLTKHLYHAYMKEI